jgi:serine phosphatase RsbU (regulator of sigma subunit)
MRARGEGVRAFSVREGNNRDDALLKEKALLLLSREREIVGLRRRHARVTGWLSVAQRLPELAASADDPSAFFDRLSRELVAQLEFQRVLFFALTARPELVPLSRHRVRAGENRGSRELAQPCSALLDERPAGMCNEPQGDALRFLSETVGLQRFMWQRLGRVDDAPLLVVAGYDAEKSSFYDPFDDEDFLHFRNMAQHFSAMLENATLFKQLAEDKLALQRFNERLEGRVRERTEELARTVAQLEERDRRLHGDLEQARSFQRRMLPQVVSSAAVEFAATYRPLELVGGDVYDVFEMGPGHFRCFVADATGHGVQASLRTMVLKSEYDRVKAAPRKPNAVLEELNRRLTVGYDDQEMLCTACCFDLVLGDGGAALLYANCAQPPLFRVSDRGVDEIYTGGPFLGSRESIAVPCVEARLQRGEVLLAYSDGLCEQLDGSGAIFAPEARLTAAAAGASLEGALEAVMRSLDEFRGATPQSDDVTMLAARLR